MLTGSLPFDGPSFNTLSKRVKSGKIAFPSYISEGAIFHYENCHWKQHTNKSKIGARDLISKMLHPKAASRLSMAGLLSHPWTNQVYPFHPVDYQKFPESRTDTSLINLEFVESLMSSNTASAASALMDVLAEYGPKRKAQLAKERNSSTKSHVTLTPSSSVTFATSNSGHAGEEDERTVVTGNNSSEGLSPALLSEIGNACNSKGKMERLQKRIRPRQQKARQRVLTASQSVRDWWSRVLHQSASIFKKRGAKKTDNVIPMEMTSEEPFGTATRGRNSALLRGGTQKSRKLPHHLRFSTSF